VYHVTTNAVCAQEPLAILLSGARHFLRGPGAQGGKRATGAALLEEEILAAQGYAVVRVDVSRASALPHASFLGLFAKVLDSAGIAVSQELKDASQSRVREIKVQQRPGRLVGPDGERLLGAVELHRQYQEGVGLPDEEDGWWDSDEDEYEDSDNDQDEEGQYEDGKVYEDYNGT
jgi:hypothetical protein